MEKKDKNKTKSKIAVVAIGIFTALYAIAYGIFCVIIYKDVQDPLLLLYGLIPLLMLFGIIAVVKMQIKEISKGEIDEARKY